MRSRKRSRLQHWLMSHVARSLLTVVTLIVKYIWHILMCVCAENLQQSLAGRSTCMYAQCSLWHKSDYHQHTGYNCTTRWGYNEHREDKITLYKNDCQHHFHIKIAMFSHLSRLSKPPIQWQTAFMLHTAYFLRILDNQLIIMYGLYFLISMFWRNEKSCLREHIKIVFWSLVVHVIHVTYVKHLTWESLKCTCP